MPSSTWFKALLLLVALWAPLSQAETGWQPIQETIRKSDKDNRQEQDPEYRGTREIPWEVGGTTLQA